MRDLPGYRILLLLFCALPPAWGGAVLAGTESAPLIRRSFRPPNYETPISGLGSELTPADRFFVRYHLANIPEVDAAGWRLTLGGEALEHPLTLDLEQLKRDFTPVEVVAVLMCAGNRRGRFEPRVPGVQWGPGAMGNARWKGVRLRDVLARAGLRKDALEIVLDGADRPVLDKTPDFVKSIPLAKALDENTLIAYEMNGAPLPRNQGFPARLIVPGWAATYWMKHLSRVDAVAKPFEGFWMKKAYRIPKDKFPGAKFASQEGETNTPVTELVVNSLITSPAEGSRHRRGRPLVLHGVAWDGGHGIAKVEISSDGGKSWAAAELGKDLGNFSWRPFDFRLPPGPPGTLEVLARATSRSGEAQGPELVWNPAGYHHNVIQRLRLRVD